MSFLGPLSEVVYCPICGSNHDGSSVLAHVAGTDLDEEYRDKYYRLSRTIRLRAVVNHLLTHEHLEGVCHPGMRGTPTYQPTNDANPRRVVA